jgi:hypothetical protein
VRDDVLLPIAVSARFIGTVCSPLSPGIAPGELSSLHKEVIYNSFQGKQLHANHA